MRPPPRKYDVPIKEDEPERTMRVANTESGRDR